MGAKYTQAQNKATQKYIKAKYEQIAIRVPKGKREEYNQLAKSKGQSLTGLIVDLLEGEMSVKSC